MHVKSFFAATVEDALAAGSREMGPEALLVQSRKAPPEARHLGACEVVLALAPPDAGTAAVAREFAELRRRLDAMRRSIAHSTIAAPRWLAPSTQTAGIFTALIEAEVDLHLAEQIAEAVATRLGPSPVDLPAALAAAAAEIESRFSVDATLGREGTAVRLVALVGPPGAGKTTTLAKLAVTYGLAARRPAVLISTDHYRIAAAEQLRAYAAILGVAFELAETPRALAQALELHRGKGLILIDTPGLAADEMEQGAELAAFLASRSDIDIEVRTGDATGMMNLAMPAIIIKMMRQKFEQQWSVRKAESSEAEQERMLRFLCDATVEIDSRLEGASFTVEEFLGLVEGDLLLFDHPLHRSFDGIINGKLKFKGQIIRVGNNKALRID
jgi:flagellar motor switch/type III secretory pathway protein FliN